MVTRAEGYRRGQGKEQPALDLAVAFCRDVLHIGVTRITDADENRQFGDLRYDRGTIEVKGQPIDPDRYVHNFVEVMEITDNPLHADGFARTAELLGLTKSELGRVRHGRTGIAIGWFPYVNVSLESVAAASHTMYVNYRADVQHVYLYRRDELLGHVRRVMLNGGVVRGAGNANEDSLAVFVPLPIRRWSRGRAPWLPV